MNHQCRRASFVWIALPGPSVLEPLHLRPSFGVSLSRRGLCGDFHLALVCHCHGGGALCLFLYPSLGLCPGGTSRETCFVCPCRGNLFRDSAYVCLHCLYLFLFVCLGGLVSVTGESAWCGGCL